MITCKVCKKEKNENEYYKRRKTKCKDCFNESRRRFCKCKECGEIYKPLKQGMGRFCSLKCRFMNKVEITKTCWLWKGGRNRNQWGKRYGTIQMGKENKLAHRISYELFKGPIPEGKIICHQCDVETCVNPDHLWVGSYKDNMLDMKNKGRDNYFTGENVPSAKLSNKDIEDIKNLKLRGVMQKDIALMYGVTRHTIQNILAGRSWRSE